MSHLKSFDLYAPVLSSDIITPAIQPTNNSDQPANNSADQQQASLDQSSQMKKKNKKKKNKNKNKSAKQQHEELLKKIDIKIPETQEDIDAWIAERKRKYPTTKRIEAKEQDNQDRKERGALDLSAQANKEKRKSQQKNRNFDPNRPLEFPTNKPTKIPSILDKISYDEERRKHSIVLQCFRYFVKHNFLQDEFDPNKKQVDDSYYSSEYYSDEELNENQNNSNNNEDNN